MSWKPGKYAKKAAASAKRAAKEAVEIGQVAITDGPAAAKKRAEESLAAAYTEAEKDWTEAKNEVFEALGNAVTMAAFEDKARAIARQHHDLIILARDTAKEISVGAYDVIAAKITTPGQITSESNAISLTQQIYGSSESAKKLQSAVTQDRHKDGFETLSVNLNDGAAGVVVGVDTGGIVGPPVLKHDAARFLPVPYREAAVAFGGIVGISAGASVGVFKHAANKQWGNFIKMTWAAGEVVGAHISIYFNLADGDFDGFEVGLEAEYGAPVNIYASMGRTMRLPLLYPTSFYD